MVVIRTMVLLTGGLSTNCDGRSRSHNRVERERNGVGSSNTRQQDREEATGTSLGSRSDAMFINNRDRHTLNYLDHSHQ
jgi:hypothetical protein